MPCRLRYEPCGAYWRASGWMGLLPRLAQDPPARAKPGVLAVGAGARVRHAAEQGPGRRLPPLSRAPPAHGGIRDAQYARRPGGPPPAGRAVPAGGRLHAAERRVPIVEVRPAAAVADLPESRWHGRRLRTADSSSTAARYGDSGLNLLGQTLDRRGTGEQARVLRGLARLPGIRADAVRNASPAVAARAGTRGGSGRRPAARIRRQSLVALSRRPRARILRRRRRPAALPPAGCLPVRRSAPT